MTTSRISDQTSPDSSKLGEWLFRHRTSLPLPIAVAILLIPAGDALPASVLVSGGLVLTVVAELIRLWGVRHIGAISRTRSDRLGPLVDTGPFAFVRNPLYIGNILLWLGFAVMARLIWVAPVAGILLAVEYHSIVKWEESLLRSRVGSAYDRYAARVPRWLPTPRGLTRSRHVSDAISFSWRETLFSERGTLMAIGVGYVLLWAKSHV